MTKIATQDNLIRKLIKLERDVATLQRQANNARAAIGEEDIAEALAARELIKNKSSDTGLRETEPNFYPTVDAVKTYVDGLSKIIQLGAAFVAAASTITVPDEKGFLVITGTSGWTINRIDPKTSGRIIVLLFTTNGIMTQTNNLYMTGSGNFTVTADDTITFITNGTNWYQLARSANRT